MCVNLPLSRWFSCFVSVAGQLYQMYGRRKPEDVFEIMTKYSASYIILEDSHCLAPSRRGCRLPDLIDTDNGVVCFSFTHRFQLLKYYYYPANAVLVCILSDIKFAVIFSVCSGTDISTTVQPIVVKFCTMIHICPGRVFSLLGAVTPRAPNVRNCGPLKKRISRKRYAAALHVN